MNPLIIFLVYYPSGRVENVILAAKTREDAKDQAFHILGGNKDHYIVDPIVTNGHRTVFVLNPLR
jgi:hypothetical protein